MGIWHRKLQVPDLMDIIRSESPRIAKSMVRPSRCHRKWFAQTWEGQWWANHWLGLCGTVELQAPYNQHMQPPFRRHRGLLSHARGRLAALGLLALFLWLIVCLTSGADDVRTFPAADLIFATNCVLRRHIAGGGANFKGFGRAVSLMVPLYSQA